MFYGASPSVFAKARQLRKNTTDAEEVLWDRLKGKQLGVKFRRQHPIYMYVADFYCHSKKLVIEVDGKYHLKQEQKEYDQFRSEDIKEFGIEVIRFTNEEVIENTDSVIEKIKEVISSRTAGSFLRTPDPESLSVRNEVKAEGGLIRRSGQARNW
jgi:very-short-patch-repair endonuclease